jgi:hypothetical protein
MVRGMMAKKILALALVMASSGGCAMESAPPILTPIEVKVPVATPVYCRVAKTARPALPIAALKADSAPDDTIRAYAATVAILQGAVREREMEIDGCAAPDSDSPGVSNTTPSEVAMPSRRAPETGASEGTR